MLKSDQPIVRLTTFRTRQLCGSLHNLRSVVGVSLYLDWFEGEPDQEVCAPVCDDSDSRGGGSRLLPEELGHEEPGDRARTHGETHHEQNHHHNRDVGEGLGLKASKLHVQGSVDFVVH